MRQDPRVHVIERLNAREMEPADLPFAPSLATVDVSFISLTKVLPAVVRCLEPGGEVLAMVKPQFELGKERVGRGVVRDPADRREAILTVAAAARELGLPVRGFASSGLPGPKGNRETFVWCGGSGAAGRGPGGGRRRRRGGRVKTAALITHSHPPRASEAVAIAAEVAHDLGWRLAATEDELKKHGAAGEGVDVTAEHTLPEICLVLGGDGSILHALRRYAHTEVPVFGVNFGTVGFLAAVDRDEAAAGIRRALEGEFETIAAARPRGQGRRQGRRSASTTSPSPGVPTTASPSSATGSPGRRSATSAATGSSPRPRPARPATTSPTRARSWPGA